MPEITGASTVAEAKAYLRAHANRGAKCPCCKKIVKVYVRKLNAAMCVPLVVLVKLYERDTAWIHRRQILEGIAPLSQGVSGMDMSHTKHWGLIEAKPPEMGKRTSGFWRPTQAGIDFVCGRSALPHAAELYNNALLRLDKSALVTISEALGERFNYPKLMATVATTSPPLSK
jgi:hypothetical protein